jgi:hypothetical protein
MARPIRSIEIYLPLETQIECLRYLAKLKGRLKRKFDQLEILITVAELLAI